MRKYNNKTKKTMIIIGILFVGIIVIFSLFLKKSMALDRTIYSIAPGSILFDNEQNMITTTEEGSIQMKWEGDYYLTLGSDTYNLGEHAVVYNSSSGDINLYGKYYEVTKEGESPVITGENIIKSSVNSKFYKLADREYLIIDRTIESSDSSFVTSNYLIIHLDKLGNATLLNDKTSYKTLKPTVLRTSAYTFDIANEKINFGKEDIDLKKIIGSTNEYDEDTYNLNATKNDDEDSSNGSGGGTSLEGSGSGGSGSANNGDTSTNNGESSVTGNINNNGTTAGTTSTFNNNSSSSISNQTVQEIVNATKNTSVIRVSSNINSIVVDYVVYDPINEYKSVYVEVENTSNSQINTIYLSKTDTSISINDLTPNVYYNLTFKYTYYDENNNLKEYTFDEVGLYTEIPKMTISVTKIASNKLYYKINLDGNYTITGGSVNLYLNDQFSGVSGSVPTGNTSEISGELDLSSLSSLSGNIVSLRLVSLSFNTYTINPGIYYQFRY